MNEKSLPEWLILWIWKALLGEIYSEIRAIAVKYTENKELTIRYYIDRKPTEDDYENISCVTTNILSNTSSNDEIIMINEEVIFTQERIGDLEILNGLIYARREYSEKDG